MVFPCNIPDSSFTSQPCPVCPMAFCEGQLCWPVLPLWGARQSIKESGLTAAPPMTRPLPVLPPICWMEPSHAAAALTAATEVTAAGEGSEAAGEVGEWQWGWHWHQSPWMRASTPWVLQPSCDRCPLQQHLYLTPLWPCSTRRVGEGWGVQPGMAVSYWSTLCNQLSALSSGALASPILTIHAKFNKCVPSLCQLPWKIMNIVIINFCEYQAREWQLWRSHSCLSHQGKSKGQFSQESNMPHRSRKVISGFTYRTMQ